MNVYLFLRKTEDWKNIPLEKCRHSFTGISELPHAPVIKEWNKKLAMTWQLFRYELQQKAFESWDKAGLTILMNKSQVESKNDEDVVVPFDDDDWVHPDIVSFIKTEMRDCACLHWLEAINSYYVGARQIFKWGTTEFQRKTMYCTSDHALRIGALRKLDNEAWGRTMYGRVNVWK